MNWNIELASMSKAYSFIQNKNKKSTETLYYIQIILYL